MLDKFITPIIKPILNPAVVMLHKRGISADQLTVIGFLIGMLALPLLAYQLWFGALIAIVLNRIFDGLDGALARHANQSSSAGGYLDITFYFMPPCHLALFWPIRHKTLLLERCYLPPLSVLARAFWPLR